MEENETVTPDYLKGFNEGYELSKLAPEIARILSKAESNSERINGFKDGHKEFLIEKDKNFSPTWLKDDKPTGKTKDISKDLDKE